MSQVVEILHGKLASLELPERFTTGARGPHPIYKQSSIFQYSSIVTLHFLEPLVAHIEFLFITKDAIILTTSSCMKSVFYFQSYGLKPFYSTPIFSPYPNMLYCLPQG